MDGAKSHGSEPASMLCETGSSIGQAKHSTRGPRHAPEGPFSPPDPRESCTVNLGNILIIKSESAPVGTEILVRVAELRQLIADYAQDPIASAAYRNEIGFLERKLVTLGLGTFDDDDKFVAGIYAGPSERDSLLEQAGVIAVEITTKQGTLGSNAVAGVTGALTDYADLISNIYLIGTFGIRDAFDSAVLDLAKISTFTATNADQVETARTARNEGLAAAELVKTTEAATLALREQNVDNIAKIAQAQADLSNALLANNAAEIAAQNTIISNATNTIRANLNSIANNAETIRTQSGIARARANSVRSTLDTLIALGNEAVDGTDEENAAITSRNNSNNAIRAKLTADLITDGTTGAIVSSGAVTAVRELDTLIAEDVPAFAGALESIKTSATVASATVQADVSTITTLTTNYATTLGKVATASTSTGDPMAVTLTLQDTAARLGNVFVEASVLTGSGSGSLLAPGNASILVQNHTSHTIKLGNMLVPDYDSANLRLNGVLVYAPDDITRLNAGGEIARFSEIDTSITSSRGLVGVRSNYNPESLALGEVRMLAPDIILEAGKVINNPRGAVNISSAAGNIYIRGAINAGSVDILAENGDFVASYVNGFRHIGGNPAGFTNPTSENKRGKGITANGAISISARFLNINSTIQSGIAEWNLTLASDGPLTAEPHAIGLSDGQIQAAIAAGQGTIEIAGAQSVTINTDPQGIDSDGLKDVVDQYKKEIVVNPDADPLRELTIDGVLTQVNIKDYLSDGATYRLEFSRDAAREYVKATGTADTTFRLLGVAGNNIGALYDAKTEQFVIDGTSVKGGYIQLFGQIMNTSKTGGELNVLDGFGTINITNNTSIPVILRNLSTGEDVSGTLRGTQGVIEITDVIGLDASVPKAPVVTVRRTTYTRSYVPGAAEGKISIATQLGTINPDGTLNLGDADTELGKDRTSKYTPNGTLRYVWTVGEDFRKVSKYTYSSTDFLTLVDLVNIELLTLNGTPQFQRRYPLADGTYLEDTLTLVGGELADEKGLAYQKTAPTPKTNASLDGTDFVTANNTVFKPENKPEIGLVEINRTRRKCNWLTFCAVGTTTYTYENRQEYTTFISNSLKANYDIAVNFIGQNEGAIIVNSLNANVVLTNTLSSRAGAVTINAGAGSSIIQGELAGDIRARQIALSAGRNIGGETNLLNPSAPVNPALVVNLLGTDQPGAFLSAQATDGNVSIISRNDLIVDQVTAGGNVTAGRGRVDLVSFGGIDGRDQGALVQAQRVTLTALGGGVGQTGNDTMLRVNTGYTANLAERPFGDPDIAPRNPAFDQANALFGLSVTATGDIGIRSDHWDGNADGTMLVVQALSSGGDVRLRSTGQILDNNPAQTIDQRTYDELLGFWDSLGLLEKDEARFIDGGVNKDKQLNMIEAFENSVTQSYSQYWSIRETQADLGAEYDPDFEFSLTPSEALLDNLREIYREEAVPARDVALAQRAVVEAERDEALAQRALVQAERDAAIAARDEALAADPAAVVPPLSELPDPDAVFIPDPDAIFIPDPDAIAARRVAAYEAERAARRQVLLTFYSDQAKAAGEAKPADVAAAKLLEFEKGRTEEYHALNETVGGLQSGFVDGYRYTATDAEKADLVRGSVWTERELAFALAPGALKTVTGTNPVIKDPNISGRTVTIEADLGIGETIFDPTTGQLGVSILSSTDPRDLTLDQRVAMAAAERSDLLLTVGPVRLPANATQAQIAAFDAAQALGLDAAGVSTTLELGAARDSLSARQQAALSAAANGLVAPEDTILTILSARPLNFAATEDVSFTVPNVSDAANRDIGAAFIASRGDARLAQISTYGETRIKVQGNITNAASSSIVTGTLILEASRGGIGTQAAPLTIAPHAGATTTARAQDGVFLNFAADGVIDTVYSPQNVALRATGSLLNANDDSLINVLGAQVSLNAGAAIGTLARALNVAAGLDGAITAQAVVEINLFGPLNFRFVIGQANAGGTIRLTGALDTVIDGLVQTPGDVSLAAGGTLSLTGQGDVHSVGGQITGSAGAIRMLTGATMRADAGRIVLNALRGNAQVTGIVSGSGSAAAVSITAAGRILAGNADPRTDIFAMAAGAGVFLSGAQGVGDQTQANAKLDEAMVTDVANALRIRTNAIAATSAMGSLILAGLGDTVFSSLTAPMGAIIGSGEGTLVITSASSGGTQSFTAPGSVTFGTLTTAGLLPTDPGDVSVTSTGSTVTGGSIDAAGTIRLLGTTIGFAALKSGVDSFATASTGAVTGGTIDAGNDVGVAGIGVSLGAVTSGRDTRAESGSGALVLTSVEAGRDAMLSGTGVSFGTIKSGQDTTMDAGTGSIAGGDIDAGRDSVVAGVGVTLDTVKTGRDSTIDGKTGPVNVIRIDAGRTSTIFGAGVFFETIIAGVDSLITSTGDIIGDLEEAGDRIVNLAGFGAGNTGILDVKILRARLLDLQSTGALTVGKVDVGEFLTLRADDITALDVTQVPAGPPMLSVTLTGANDTVATRARVNVDAPFGLVLPSLKVSETTLGTTAEFVDVQSAEIPLQGTSPMQGTLVLSTPSQILFVDNRSQTPKGNPPSNLQVFEPTRPFAATLNGTGISTDSFVVTYDPSVQVTDVLGLPYDGISLVRDTVRNIRQSDRPIHQLEGFFSLPGDTPPDDEDDLEISDLNDTIVEINGIEYDVFVRGTGPAVLLSR